MWTNPRAHGFMASESIILRSVLWERVDMIRKCCCISKMGLCITEEYHFLDNIASPLPNCNSTFMPEEKYLVKIPRLPCGASRNLTPEHHFQSRDETLSLLPAPSAALMPAFRPNTDPEVNPLPPG
jgi:hypothetical protein